MKSKDLVWIVNGVRKETLLRNVSYWIAKKAKSTAENSTHKLGLLVIIPHGT